jgi:hypothetical protein
MRARVSSWLKSAEWAGTEVDLLRLRSDPNFTLPEGCPDFRQDPLFIELPPYSAKSIGKFASKFKKTGSLRIALQAIPFDRPFQASITQQLVLTQSSQLIHVLFLYQCFAWIVLPDSEPRSNTALNLLLEGLNSLAQVSFPFSYNYVVHDVILISVDPVEFGIDSRNLRGILNQIALNQNLDARFSPVLMVLFDRVMEIEDDDITADTLALLVALFQHHSGVIKELDFFHFLSLLTRMFHELNQDVLYIMACASHLTDNAIIRDCFVVLPTCLLNHFYERDLVFKFEKVCGLYTDDTPLESMISAPKTLVEYCDEGICSLASQLNLVLSIATPEVAECFVQAFDASDSTFCGDSSPADFFVFLCLLLEPIGRTVSIAPLVPILLNSVIFDFRFSIFADGGVPPQLNAVRQCFFQSLAALDCSHFYTVLDVLSQSPFLAAECMVRLSYRFQASFFADEVILMCLFSSIHILQQKTELMNHSVKKKTQSVLFSTLFSILDDPSIALECFARHAFSTSFLNLMFNKKYTSIVIDSFSTCVSKFDEIPEPIVVFLSLVFVSCPSDGDSHFMEIALRLMKGMVHALSHNANLGKSFSAVYENCFGFARKSKSKEALECSLTILTFIVQSTALFTMSDQMFNSLLDVCEQLEGDEPSEIGRAHV